MWGDSQGVPVSDTLAHLLVFPYAEMMQLDDELAFKVLDAYFLYDQQSFTYMTTCEEKY